MPVLWCDLCQIQMGVQVQVRGAAELWMEWGELVEIGGFCLTGCVVVVVDCVVRMVRW